MIPAISSDEFFPLLGVLLLQLAAAPILAQDGHAEPLQAATPFYAVPESTGDAQSPINILTGIVERGRHDIALRYLPSAEHIVNLGHTIEAEFEPGSSLEYDGLVYELKQLHFHTPAEHLVDGITYPMELHMVHTLRDRPDRYLVVGILFREGSDNAFVEEILGHAPAEAGARFDGTMQINAQDLLPAVEGYYHYEGSLTTPPYSETVTWLVMKESRQASADQVERLNRIEGNNARHIQDLHGRHVDAE
jgi:carbonic anhydrase